MANIQLDQDVSTLTPRQPRGLSSMSRSSSRRDVYGASEPGHGSRCERAGGELDDEGAGVREAVRLPGDGASGGDDPKTGGRERLNLYNNSYMTAPLAPLRRHF